MPGAADNVLAPMVANTAFSDRTNGIKGDCAWLEGTAKQTPPVPPSRASSRGSTRGKNPVPSDFRRLRYTFRNRTGGGIQGASQIVNAFKKYDRAGTGMVSPADFAKALKDLQIVLPAESLKQATNACEDVSGRVDYQVLVRKIMPEEAASMNLTPTPSRPATSASSPVGAGESGMFMGFTQEEIAPYLRPENYPRRVSDVTTFTLNGDLNRIMPQEKLREPALNIYGDAVSHEPREGRRNTLMPEEEALWVLRRKLDSRKSLKNRGDGSFFLRKAFSYAHGGTGGPATVAKDVFMRAMDGMNLNLPKVELNNLYRDNCDAKGNVEVDKFIRRVVQY